MIKPYPYVKLDGGPVQGGLTNPVDWAGVVIADLEISWGRSHWTEHEPAGQARVKLILKARYVQWTRNPQGRKIEIGYTVPGGSSVPLFRGRLEDGEIEYYKTVGGENWYIGTFDAISVLAELDRRKLAGDRAEETIASRKTYLAGQATDTALVASVGGAGVATSTRVIPVSYAQMGIYSALQTMYNTLGEFAAYDPEIETLHADGYLSHSGSDPMLVLRVLPNNKVGITAQGQPQGMIRARECEMVPLRLTQRQQLWQTKTMGEHRQFIDGELKTTTATHRYGPIDSRTTRRATIFQDVPTLAQITVKVNTSTVTQVIDDTSLATAAAYNQKVYAVETEFIHPPVTRRFKNGFDDEAWARSILGAHLRRSGIWIAGSVYNELAEKPILPRIIGGVIRFDDGVWETTHNLASIPTRDPAPIDLSVINPNTSWPIFYEDFDESITLADLALVEQGL